MLNFACVRDIIPRTQHGFTDRGSTATNLLEITQFIRDQNEIIYLDFSKAFDRINCAILARRLAELSMPLTVFKNTKKFVFGRKYILKVDGVVQNESFETFITFHMSNIIDTGSERNITSAKQEYNDNRKLETWASRLTKSLLSLIISTSSSKVAKECTVPDEDSLWTFVVRELC